MCAYRRSFKCFNTYNNDSFHRSSLLLRYYYVFRIVQIFNFHIAKDIVFRSFARNIAVKYYVN
jgi:hypothetical protein